MRDLFGLRAYVEQCLIEDDGMEPGSWQLNYLTGSYTKSLADDVRRKLWDAPPVPWSGRPWAGGCGRTLEPCQDEEMFPSDRPWTPLPSRYAWMYPLKNLDCRDVVVDLPPYTACNWWVEANHPAVPKLSYDSRLPRGHTPVAGAAMWFDPYEQGASATGHWAHVVGVSYDNYWLLISESGVHGEGHEEKLHYRYAHASDRTWFIYDYDTEARNRALVEEIKLQWRKHRNAYNARRARKERRQAQRDKVVSVLRGLVGQ